MSGVTVRAAERTTTLGPANAPWLDRDLYPFAHQWPHEESPDRVVTALRAVLEAAHA